MKQKYIDKRFGADALALLAKINDILVRYEEQGYDLSLRQLYYQLVAANTVENTERSYKNVGNLVSDARLAGLVDWDMIKDRGRTSSANAHWTTPRQFIDSVAPQFAIDKWLDQDNYVEVMVEKQALEGVLEPVCNELDVRFSANKGYSSSTAMRDAGLRFMWQLRNEKTCHLIYLGDHDPSGMDMTRDVEERIRLFSGGEVEVHRVALNMDQIRKLRPPENPAKLTDSRADDYIAKYGRSSWELDAIEPRALATLVRSKVYELRDVDVWESTAKRETRMRNELLSLAKKSKFE